MEKKERNNIIEKLKSNWCIYAGLSDEEKEVLESIDFEHHLYYCYSSEKFKKPSAFDCHINVLPRIKPDYTEDTFKTLDGVEIRIGVDKCYGISGNTLFPSFNYWEGDGSLKYFFSKEKADLYLKGLNGNQLQEMVNSGSWYTIDIDCIDWSKPIEQIRVKPTDPLYEPYTEPQENLKGVWVKHKSSHQEWLVTGFKNIAENCYYTFDWISNIDMFRDFTHLDGTPIGQLKK